MVGSAATSTRSSTCACHSCTRRARVRRQVRVDALRPRQAQCSAGALVRRGLRHGEHAAERFTVVADLHAPSTA